MLSAALKAAQLDSPTDDGLTDTQPEEQPESPSVDCQPVEVQSESDESPLEEDQTMDSPPSSESSPVQEQGDEETQTEPLEEQEDHEESPPGSPVFVCNHSILRSVLHDMSRCSLLIY